jgi:hypothetical protein
MRQTTGRGDGEIGIGSKSSDAVTKAIHEKEVETLETRDHPSKEHCKTNTLKKNKTQVDEKLRAFLLGKLGK